MTINYMHVIQTGSIVFERGSLIQQILTSKRKKTIKKGEKFNFQNPENPNL